MAKLFQEHWKKQVFTEVKPNCRKNSSHIEARVPWMVALPTPGGDCKVNQTFHEIKETGGELFS